MLFRSMNALDPTVAEFRERLKHERTEKRRRLNAMIDGASADDQVRGLLDRHKARMARYVRWENWPVGEFITASSCRSLLPLRADARDRPVARAFPARTSLPAGPVPGADRERHEKIVDMFLETKPAS